MKHLRRDVVGATVLAALAVIGCGGGPNEEIGRIYDLKRNPTAENVRKIRTRLDDPDRDVRATAVNALVTLEVDDADRVALDALDDEDGFVRATAAKLLGDLGDVGHVDVLARALHDDPDAVVRQRAAEALAELGGAAALDALTAGLSDPIDSVRLAAVRGVRHLGPDSAVPQLIEMLLDDPVWEIRVQAAGALGEVDDPAATAALEQAASDESEFVRSAAANALGAQRKRQ